MNRFLKTATLLAAIAGVAGSTANAAIIVDKAPNASTGYERLEGSPEGSYVYTNSFIFTAGGTGSTMNLVGVYMRNVDTTQPGTQFRFEVYADNANSPDPTAVLGVTNYMSFAGGTITLVTDSLLVPINLTFGSRYWIAASVIPNTTDGPYAVAGHIQNSVYPDNGTFWFSNDPTGQTFIGPILPPEMAIYAEGDLRPIVGAVPEPASLTIWGLGLIGCAVAVRRRRKLAE